MPARAVTLFDQPRQPPTSHRTFAEFFAGIGLARLGFERAGWEIRFANDLDPQKLQMYERQFGPAPYYTLTDVHELDASQLETVLVAHASFPCTDLSVAGARRGLFAGQSSAFWGFHRVLRDLGHRRPPFVLLENVLGFLSSNEGRDFHCALAALCELGYSVDAFAVDAAHFVPQSRPRLFVIGKQAVEEPTLDPSEVAPDELRPASLLSAMRRTRELSWSLRELPSLPPYGTKALKSILDSPKDTSREWWSDERRVYLLNQMSARHRQIADEMIRRKTWSYGTVFRRVRNGRSMAELRTDGLAGCLRTPKGGSGRQILFQAGYGRYKVRLLNPRECARLMGADGFNVEGVPPNQALFGFGDAVCADVIEWIAREYLNPLADALSDKKAVEAA